MAKQIAIVDTCFLLKIADQGKQPNNIKILLDNTNYIPVAHQYVVEHEFVLHGFLKQLIAEKYVTVVEYEEFLTNDFARQLYETSFVSIYNLKSRNFIPRRINSGH